MRLRRLVSPSAATSDTLASSSGVPSGLTMKISTSTGAVSERAASRTRENGGGARSSGFSVVLPSLSVIFRTAVRTPGGTSIGRRTVPSSCAEPWPSTRPPATASTFDPGRVSITIVSEPVRGMESQRSSRSLPSSIWASTSATEGTRSGGALNRARTTFPWRCAPVMVPTLVENATLAPEGASTSRSAPESLPRMSCGG